MDHDAFLREFHYYFLARAIANARRHLAWERAFALLWPVG